MRKLIVSIHSTFNGVVTGPDDDETNFMIWAGAGIEGRKDLRLELPLGHNPGAWASASTILGRRAHP